MNEVSLVIGSKPETRLTCHRQAGADVEDNERIMAITATVPQIEHQKKTCDGHGNSHLARRE